MLSWGREQVMIMDDDNWKLYLLNPQVLPLPLPLPLLRHRTDMCKRPPASLVPHTPAPTYACLPKE